MIVVGLGAHGSAALRALAAGGARVIGIDRFAPPHAHGSSHGETRITRQAVGEGEAYVPLVLRSHEIWRELEAETGEALLLACGGLVLGSRGGAARHGVEDFLGRTIAVAGRFGIAHEVLDAAEIGRRFPQFGLRGDEVGYYEPGAGMLYPERCVEAQLRAARARGARVLTDETVLAVDQCGDGILVTTDRGAYAADRAVVAAGAWIPGLVGGPFARHLAVHRQVLAWFEPADPAAYAPGRFPVFIWSWGTGTEDVFYGFPLAPGGTPGVKVATEQFIQATDPDAMERTATEAEARALHDRHVAPRLRGVGPLCARAAACSYTTSPDSGFLVGAHPAHERVLVVSACSGHGFKHSAALGEAVAALLTGGVPRIDLGPFAASRLAGRTGSAPADPA